MATYKPIFPRGMSTGTPVTEADDGRGIPQSTEAAQKRWQEGMDAKGFQPWGGRYGPRLGTPIQSTPIAPMEPNVVAGSSTPMTPNIFPNVGPNGGLPAPPTMPMGNANPVVGMGPRSYQPKRNRYTSNPLLGQDSLGGLIGPQRP